MGIKCSSTRTLILEDALVPKENLLGEIGKGHIIAFNILNIGRYKLGVGTVGCETCSRNFSTICKPTSTVQTTNRSLPINSRETCEYGKTYATESSVYRTVGLFESRMSTLSEEEVKTVKQ